MAADLYPHWALLDEEAVYLSTFVGLAELALGGCTTTTDHLYVHPAGAGDMLAAEIAAAGEIGVRFHPTRGSMSVSEKDGGLPPDSVCRTRTRSWPRREAAVAAHHDRSAGAMVRVALAPCSPFTVSRQLMSATAELAERLDVRLHTHLAEDPDEDSYCLGPVRLPAGRVLRGRRLAFGPFMGGSLRPPEPVRDRAPRTGGGRRRSLPELQPVCSGPAWPRWPSCGRPGLP